MINNLALLLSLGIVYDIGSYVRRIIKRFEPYFNGLLIGMIGLLIMSVPIKYPGGVILDTRCIRINKKVFLN